MKARRWYRLFARYSDSLSVSRKVYIIILLKCILYLRYYNNNMCLDHQLSSRERPIIILIVLYIAVPNGTSEISNRYRYIGRCYICTSAASSSCRFSGSRVIIFSYSSWIIIIIIIKTTPMPSKDGRPLNQNVT